MCAFLSSFSFLILLCHLSLITRSDALNTNGLERQISKESKADSYVFFDNFTIKNLNSSAKENCNEKKTCANGGSCLQHECVCLPGTSGSFCETIDDCKYGRLCGEEETYCEYNVEKQKALCTCGVIEYRFDDLSKTCKNCICSSGWSSDFNVFSYCEYKHGNKICTCREGYAYNPRKEYCDYCRSVKNMKWCKFDEKGNQVYVCEDGYSYNSRNGECKECQCGSNGKCHYQSTWSKTNYCDCDEGYEEFNQTCVECLCGKYGNCIFDNNGTQTGCDCKPGYSEKLGTCEMCYCGDNTTCSFRGSRKMCSCSDGFHDVNGFCEDIDECEKHNPCGPSSTCINTVGSYKCPCAEGFEKKTIILQNYTEVETCADIDECINLNTCPMPDSACLNTVGSFVCICSPGFASRGGIVLDIFCEKTTDGSIYTVVTVMIFTVLLILLGFYMVVRRRSN